MIVVGWITAPLDSRKNVSIQLLGVPYCCHALKTIASGFQLKMDHAVTAIVIHIKIYAGVKNARSCDDLSAIIVICEGGA